MKQPGVGMIGAIAACAAVMWTAAAAQSQAHELEEIRLVVHHQHHGLLGHTAAARRRLAHQLSHRRGSANTSLKRLPPPGRGS